MDNKRKRKGAEGQHGQTRGQAMHSCPASISSTSVVYPAAESPATCEAAATDKKMKQLLLSSSASYNSLGIPLPDSWDPYCPAGEDLVAVRIEIDGSKHKPPCDRVFFDEVLWNVHETSLSPEEFARITCDEEDLPASFVEPIASHLRDALAAYEPQLDSPASCRPLDLQILAERRGILLQDRVLWDAAPPSAFALSVEEFAGRLCEDMSLPSDFSVAVAVAMRCELQRLTAGDEEEQPSASRDRSARVQNTVVRSESEALEWSPLISMDPNDEAKHAGRARADRGDRYRRRIAMA
mmetsp:Transcript_14506/g.31110  ORF Transcript_14506/g.31110 Transcript_14506/m.31110 type:complete len:296 (-) Transcript_14506:268-1155(-)